MKPLFVAIERLDVIVTVLYERDNPSCVLAQRILFIEYPELDTAEMRIDSGESLTVNSGQVHLVGDSGPVILHLQWNEALPGIFPCKITKRLPVE